ncbi:MAG: hypothetical protein H7Y37_00730 [Anaerolineae bacterium]|nr:hypothetical protein [Gloeobacterales cyanobacterium ES-bin-313]
MAFAAKFLSGLTTRLAMPAKPCYARKALESSVDICIMDSQDYFAKVGGEAVGL